MGDTTQSDVTGERLVSVYRCITFQQQNIPSSPQPLPTLIRFTLFSASRPSTKPYSTYPEFARSQDTNGNFYEGGAWRNEMIIFCSVWQEGTTDGCCFGKREA